MKHYKLYIRQFKCLKDTELLLKNLTVFTGGNGCGKSSVIQALLFLRRTIEHCSTWIPSEKKYKYESPNGLNVELNGAYCLNLGNSANVLWIDAKTNDITIGLKDCTSGDGCFSVKYSTIGNEQWITPIEITNNLFNNPLYYQEFYYLNAERIGPRINQETHFYDYPNVGFKGEFTAQIIEKLNFEKEYNDIETIKEIITGIRNIRNNMNVHPSKKSKIIFVTKTKKDAIESGRAFIEKLGFAQEIVVLYENKDIPENAISLTVPEIEIYMPFEDLVDIEAEKQRLTLEREKYLSEIARVDKMLSNPGFVSKAPAKKIEEEKAKKVKYEEMLKAVEERLSKM